MSSNGAFGRRRPSPGTATGVLPSERPTDSRPGDDLQGILRLRRLVRRLALLIGFLTAASIPLGYLAVASTNQGEVLSLRAELSAKRLARHVAEEGERWHESREPLEGLLAIDSLPDRSLHQIVRRADGSEVADRGSVPDRPRHRRTAAILLYDGEAVGEVTVEASLRPLLFTAAVTALFSFTLGGGAYLVLCLLPLRALDRSVARLRSTLERLETHAIETNCAYEELKRQHRLVEETTQELMKARDEALDANRTKSAFLATMSHELRTPLNAIIGFSEVLTLGIFGPLGNDRYRDYCQAIGDSGRHLLAVINDVLDISKIEAGKFQLHFEEVELEKLLRSCCTLVRAKLDEAGVELLLTPIDEPLPKVWADPVKLKQIALNLLSNALKFTPGGGGITISLGHAPDGIRFSIADSGIGMTATDIELALQPFQQVDNHHTRKYEGTGLGLPLAKALVEQHGGELRIASAPGAGTTVTVVLPDHGMVQRHGPEDGQGQLDLQAPRRLGRRSA